MPRLRRRRGRARTRAQDTAPIEAPKPAASAAPVRFETVLEEAETMQREVPPHSQDCMPLLASWPVGYRGFRLDGSGVILFAEGKPDLRLDGAF